MAAAVMVEPLQAAIIITRRALPETAADRAYSGEQIDRRRLMRSPARTLDQLLKEVAGVQLFRRSDARSGHPTSQGVTLRALGGNASSRALLILDGVPQADPFGGWINWPAFDRADLAEVSVVRGGGSVVYGPGALAGTIAMASRADLGVSGATEGGSRASLDASGRAGIRLGGGTLALSAHGARSAGFVPITQGTRGPADEDASYSNWNARGRWVTPVSRTSELQANLSTFHDWRTRGTDFTASRTNGVDASLRLVGRGAWQWSALGYWQSRNLRSSFANVNADRSIATRVSLQDSVPSTGVGASFELRPPLADGLTLSIGGDARRTDGESRELYAYSAGQPARRRRAGGESWTAGLFGEGSAQLGRLVLSGGARLDRWQVTDGHLFEQVIAGSKVVRDEHYAERGGWRPTARAGAVLEVDEALSLRSAAYLGWRMPTLNELFRPFRAGLDATAANPLLQPERLTGVEAGANYRAGSLRLALTGFVNRLYDAIANVTLGHGPGTFPGVGSVAAGGTYRQRENAGTVHARGIEASAQWTSGPWFATVAASLTHARMSANGPASFLSGLRPAQTPSFAGTLAAGWDRHGKSAELLVRRVGGQYEDDLNTRLLKGATTLDASAAWPLGRRFQLVASGENLTNRLVIAGIGGDGAIERATPRTFWLGIRLSP